MTVKEIRQKYGNSIKRICDKLNIPRATWENWEYARTSPPDYVVELIEYRLRKERQKFDDLLKRL